MSAVLVINSGSSSMKYQLVDVLSGEALAAGLLERIGEPFGHAAHSRGESQFESDVPLPDHAAAFRQMIAAFEAHGPSLSTLDAVGHRVVQGGARYAKPAIINERVEVDIAELADLAPLHNPANLVGIKAARAAFPAVPHVAVFDTAFHQSMPAAAYTYAIDQAIAKQYGVRRFGFHGTSHRYVSRAAAEFLETPVESLNQIVFHLGNGASVCAIRGGASIETSMGMTPLQGLVMGTRSGDLDPAVLIHLARVGGLGIDDLDHLLNHDSGLKGLSGHGDMRDVQRAAEAGDEAAKLALDVYVHRAKGYLGNYAVQLGTVDTIVFTAGVGEHSPEIRAAICADLEAFGIRIDAARNEAPASGPRVISADDSRITVLVVPTNEELEIARQTVEAIRA